MRTVMAVAGFLAIASPCWSGDTVSGTLAVNGTKVSAPGRTGRLRRLGEP